MRLSILLTLATLGCGGVTSAAGDASPSDATGAEASTGDTTSPADTGPNACLAAGGTCGCAGSCGAGTRHGTFVQDNACPQPCPTCGGCSMWCCVPEAADAAFDTAGITCSDPSTFPAFGKSCGADVDCAFGLHQIDCCGSLRAVGFAKVHDASFAAAEEAWSGTCPACDCAAKPTVAEDGNTGTAFGARCTGGACSTYVK